MDILKELNELHDKRDELELEDCNKCNGLGKIEHGERNEYYSSFWYLCSKCHGRGELDWIEQIVGIKTPVDVWSQKTLKLYGIKKKDLNIKSFS